MARGAEGSRTLDLLNAIQALSQLSYGPTRQDGTRRGRSLPYTPHPTDGQTRPSIHEVATRIHRLVVLPHLVVKVRAGGASGRADRPELLPAADALAFAHGDLREMPVERLEVAAVIDDDQPAVARVAAGVDHLAGAAGGHGLADPGLDVDAGMHLAAVAVG